MLKINLKNQNLKKSSARKETTLILSHIFHTFLKNKIFKTKNHNARLSSYVNYWNSKHLFQSSFTKERTICFLTGRSRSVYRSFHLSRLKLREYAAAGYFSGLSKASW